MAIRMNLPSTLSTMIATLVLATPLWAAELKDPTQPPDTQTPVVRGATQDASKKLLRSIRIDARGSVAVIDGATLREGDSTGEFVVKVIRPYEVVLLTASGDQTLKLYPRVEKIAARKEPSHPVARKGKNAHVAKAASR